MQASLLPYFTTPSPPSQVEVSLTGRENGLCRIVYRITHQPLGPAQTLSLPAHCGVSRFADQLWQDTCCEAFVATPGNTAYREFNFSPSGQWAIYDFTDYRQGMRRHQANHPPQINCQPTAEGFLLTVDVEQDLFGPPPWQIGLSCILKYTDGSIDYRALTHPNDKPDFHHRASFTLTLNHF